MLSTRRRVLETQALEHPSATDNQQRQLLKSTYNKPVAKTIEIPNLRRIGICNFQIWVIGIRRMEKSETMLITVVVMIAMLILTHVPSNEGFQIFARGVHSKISTSTSAI